MTRTGNKGRLRLVRIAGESVLKEKILPRERLNRELVGVIASQLKGLVEEMEAAWEVDPASDELREGFHLLDKYLECLKKYRKSSV
jgi:hypothetical protein